MTINTPLIHIPSLSAFGMKDVWIKCENMQVTHSFKARGAANAVAKLPKKVMGVITHSSGNHGQALAWAAKQKNIHCIVVVPENAPKVKIAAIGKHGAEIIFCAPGIKSREAAMQAVINNNGYHFIPPYNHHDIIEGQSTCAKEMLLQNSQLEVILAPVGGGGLLSGTLVACEQKAVDVFGCEPEAADDAYRSLLSGKMEDPGNPQTIADGLRTGLGEITFSIISKNVKGILTVSEEEIIQAWAFAIHNLKLIIEPSCAVPLAVLKKYSHLFANQSIGIIITGGNVDMERLPSSQDAEAYLCQ
jgi:threonine dehydratase